MACRPTGSAWTPRSRRSPAPTWMDTRGAFVSTAPWGNRHTAGHDGDVKRGACGGRPVVGVEVQGRRAALAVRDDAVAGVAASEGRDEQRKGVVGAVLVVVLPSTRQLGSQHHTHGSAYRTHEPQHLGINPDDTDTPRAL
eukprot:2960127-Rhodomonas_salina.1